MRIIACRVVGFSLGMQKANVQGRLKKDNTKLLITVILIKSNLGHSHLIFKSLSNKDVRIRNWTIHVSLTHTQRLNYLVT